MRYTKKLKKIIDEQRGEPGDPIPWEELEVGDEFEMVMYPDENHQGEEPIVCPAVVISTDADESTPTVIEGAVTIQYGSVVVKLLDHRDPETAESN